MKQSLFVPTLIITTASVVPVLAGYIETLSDLDFESVVTTEYFSTVNYSSTNGDGTITDTDGKYDTVTLSGEGEGSDYDYGIQTYNLFKFYYGEAYLVEDQSNPYYPLNTGIVPIDSIEIFIQEDVYELILEAGAEGVEFWFVNPSVTITDVPISMGEGCEEFDFSIDYATGIVTIWYAGIPEPSMFGVLFGLSALGLVATRRRRRA